MILLALIVALVATAQDKTILAKSEYMAAEEAYSNGNFEKCISHLAKAKEYFGGSNYLIQYLEVKAFYENRQFTKASQAISDFFKTIPEQSKSSSEYTEMVKLLSAINSKQEAEEFFNKGKLFYDEKNYSEAMVWFNKAAEQGNPNGQLYLGLMYENGIGVARDMAEAVKYYRKSAEQGHSDGQFQLGHMYQEGHGLTKDLTEAKRLYRNAAEQGSGRAEFELSLLSDDYRESLTWLKKAADHGSPDANYRLSLIYFSAPESWEVAKDMRLALQYAQDVLKVEPQFEILPEFMNHLAYCYFEIGDLQNAISTLKTALKNSPDYANGFDSLGEMYLASGDRTKAIENYKIAASMGYDHAIKWCKENKVKYNK